MSRDEFIGVLAIGDPHLEGRQPGFRKDDYPMVILEKLEWSIEYARQHRLLPVILGDLFDKPRDNPNWLINRLLQILDGEILTVYGNHDVHHQPVLTDDDSLSLLVNSGRLQLISSESFWSGTMNQRHVVVGGSSYRQEIPKKFDVTPLRSKQVENPLVIWITHHDIMVPGYDEGRVKPRDIDGIDMVINGHIHRPLETVITGQTQWITPGNISRRSRSDATRDHQPSVLRIDVSADSQACRHVVIPHRPFDEVFYEAVVETTESETSSAFVSGLAELQTRRTDSGAGLKSFLSLNVDQFDPPIADAIWRLANEVTDEENSKSKSESSTVDRRTSATIRTTEPPED